MKKIICAILFICSLVSCLTSCEHEHTHKWESATCTTPKRCSDCGKTEGMALEHSFGDWKETIKGDCSTINTVKERTCNNCQYCETQTIPPSHNYSYGVCTKCKKPLIENMELRDHFSIFNTTLNYKNHIYGYGVKWKDIVPAETPNTYHCKIGFSIYQYDYSSVLYRNDYVKLKYVITDSSGDVVLEKIETLLLTGGYGGEYFTYYISEKSHFIFEFDITLDPNETYRFQICKYNASF